MHHKKKYSFCRRTGLGWVCLVIFLFFPLLAHGNPQDHQFGYKTDSKPIPAGPYTAEEQAFIDARPIITVANEFDWPPFDFIADGLPAGFGIDLMDLLARKSGLSISYVNGYTWEELMEMFFKGHLDVVHSLSLTPERQQKALFSSPYYHSKNVLIFRSDALDIQTLDDLEKKIIALPKGWSSIEFFKTHYPKVHIIEVESSRQALEYVDQGKVTATVEQEGIARYFIKKFGFTDLALSPWLENEELQKTSSMHFAVLKTNPILFSILDKTLASITSAEMEQLKNKWFSRSGRQIGGEDVGLTPEERNWLKNKKQISVCVPPERMPFSAIRGNQVVGMTADLLEIFEEKLNISFQAIPALSFADAIDKVATGAWDIVPMISKTEARKGRLDFTSAFMEYNVVILSRENFSFITDLPGLKSKTIGMVAAGNVLERVIEKYPKLNYVPMETIEDCLIDVSTGQLDTAVLSLPAASHYIRKTGLTNLKVAGHSSIKEDLRMGVQKENKQLHSIMSKVVRSLSQNELDTISQKWLGQELENKPDYGLLWKSLSAFGIVLVLVVLWNRNLSRLNKQIAIAHEKLSQKTQELEHISVTDSLTEIFNRRHIEATFELELKRSRRHGRELSIILLDIDFFKTVNDTFGHQTGDTVLKLFTGLIEKNIRATDILGRWGGEEFLIVCPETNLENACHLAGALRRRIGTERFGKAGSQTASFGVTAFKKEDDSQAMISRADKALYLAKSNGRNQVERIQ
ncbi:MAG: transporter substrate-binding domain-containing protein [Proteobacteria bacterium]|nr:transporter substrate-binding domain-containing protein [Desulfobacula sp.]MBU3951900.1 transporter substrate-binding domain-containing protein [Pseudomonadota bacterium]MBU4129978.1 transporter substrate-binding domain-containing protein [Pseudomonadota bacterium]